MSYRSYFIRPIRLIRPIILSSYFPLLVLGLLFVILRLPSLFEPHWYGDEGITMAVGQEINRGKQLYIQISDNKPPLLYQIARHTDNIFRFRLLTTLWILPSLGILWYLFHRLALSRLGILLTVILLSTPLFEANIANGEIWFIPLTIAGMTAAVVGLKTPPDTHKQNHPTSSTTRSAGWFFLSGSLFGLGSLLKVPALLDGAAAGIIILAGPPSDNTDSAHSFISDSQPNASRIMLKRLLLLAAGMITPWVVVSLWMQTQNALIPFLDQAILNNIRYAGTWGTDPFFTHSRLIFKLGFLVLTTLLVTRLKNRLPFPLRLGLIWLAFATVGALLSNRPYRHYFIQTIPAWGILLNALITVYRHKKRSLFIAGSSVSLILLLFLGRFFSLNVGDLYDQIDYYRRFFRYLRHPKNTIEYMKSFDSRVPSHYRAAALINHLNPGAKTLVWSEDWNIYSLGHLPTTGRYPTDFNTHDLPGGYESLNADLTHHPPQFVVTAQSFRYPAPKLATMLQKRYHLIANINKSFIYEKI